MNLPKRSETFLLEYHAPYTLQNKPVVKKPAAKKAAVVKKPAAKVKATTTTKTTTVKKAPAAAKKAKAPAAASKAKPAAKPKAAKPAAKKVASARSGTTAKKVPALHFFFLACALIAHRPPQERRRRLHRRRKLHQPKPLGGLPRTLAQLQRYAVVFSTQLFVTSFSEVITSSFCVDCSHHFVPLLYLRYPVLFWQSRASFIMLHYIRCNMYYFLCMIWTLDFTLEEEENTWLGRFSTRTRDSF